MELDNARELKASIIENINKQIAKASTIRAMGIQTQASNPKKGAMRAFAIGITRKGKQHQIAIRIQRRTLEESSLLDNIKKKAKDEVEIRYVGRILKMETPATLQKTRRPLVIGCSIGHYKITAGTLGCFVISRTDQQRLILSNNHVLANENAASAGDAILQRAKFDGGTVAADGVGKLVAFQSLKPQGVNFVDCAVASIKDSINIRERKLGNFGDLAGVAPPITGIGIGVKKVGRTTGESTGRITAFELDNVVVGYDIGNVRFDNQMEIEGDGSDPFSAGGDSGSLIVDNDLAAVGLLFAGGDQGGSNGMGLTYANPIQVVLDTLKVDLIH